ncbi:MAG: IS3 family transposase, partial [Bacteroides sp.]
SQQALLEGFQSLCALVINVNHTAANRYSPEEFVKALEEYIVYYNNKRIKSRLKGKSPVQFRTLSQSN